jgi:hypothetical protein
MSYLGYAQAYARSRAAWGPIWAGTLITLAFFLLFAMLGTAIKLTATASGGAAEPAGAAAIGAAVWTAVFWIVSMFLGALAAGRLLSGRESRFEGALHGLTVWGLATVVAAGLVGAANIRAERALAQSQAQAQAAPPGTQQELGTDEEAAAGARERAGTIGVTAGWAGFGSTAVALFAAALAGALGVPSRERRRTVYEPGEAHDLGGAAPAPA